MKNQPAIFICDPDNDSATPLAEHLQIQGYSVRYIAESDVAIDRTLNQMPSLVLLNTKLPSEGGFSVCHAIRPYFRGPIIFQSDHDNEAEQLLAFERGGDDFIVKPISPPLMAARIDAHLRRPYHPNGNPNGLFLQSGDLTIDASRREVKLDGRSIVLTTIQFELLWYLASHSGRVISREELYEELFHQKYNGFDRSVDVYISRIRHKLHDDVEHPHFLRTVRGVGYLFVSHAPCSP